MNEQRNMIMPKGLIVKDKPQIALSESRKLHRWKIGAHSTLGSGSKFRVGMSTNKPLIKIKVVKGQANIRSHRILIVENNEAEMSLISEICRNN